MKLVERARTGDYRVYDDLETGSLYVSKGDGPAMRAGKRTETMRFTEEQRAEFIDAWIRTAARQPEFYNEMGKMAAKFVEENQEPYHAAQDRQERVTFTQGMQQNETLHRVHRDLLNAIRLIGALLR